MSANFIWSERNGRAPGSPSEDISNMNWKAVDDTTTSYSASNAIITAGTNSYTKWTFGSFTGPYTTIANVSFGHYAGVFGPGLTLMCQKSMVDVVDYLTYSTPTRAINNTTITPYDLTSVGASVTLFTGADGPDAAAVKSAISTNPGNGGVGGTLYTNYIVTQLQTTTSALPGDTVLVTLRIQYDEA